MLINKEYVQIHVAAFDRVILGWTKSTGHTTLLRRCSTSITWTKRRNNVVCPMGVHMFHGRPMYLYTWWYGMPNTWYYLTIMTIWQYHWLHKSKHDYFLNMLNTTKINKLAKLQALRHLIPNLSLDAWHVYSPAVWSVDDCCCAKTLGRKLSTPTFNLNDSKQTLNGWSVMMEITLHIMFNLRTVIKRSVMLRFR